MRVLAVRVHLARSGTRKLKLKISATLRMSTRSSVWWENARSELLGTRLRANEYRKVFSFSVTDGVADHGGHDGRVTDVRRLRHHVVPPSDHHGGAAPWLPLSHLGSKKITM